MNRIKILIVDDSIVYRSQIRIALEKQVACPIEIVASASNGRTAIEKLKESHIDLVILDLEMPEMDGLETLKEISNLSLKSKVIVFSSISKRGADITLEALKYGASDFAQKPCGNSNAATNEAPFEKIRSILIPKIEALFIQKTNHGASIQENYEPVVWNKFHPEVVVIGSSTGGPQILDEIFSQLSNRFSCPILIVQHMPPVFTRSLAERIEKINGAVAREAIDGEDLEGGRIYIAPGNYHLRLKEIQGKIKISLDQEKQVNFVRPAVDPLFETAAQIFSKNCLGIILTGMGHDGMAGAQAIKNKGGAVIIQNEESCTVFGMPRAVLNVKAYDRIATPQEIVDILREKIAPV